MLSAWPNSQPLGSHPARHMRRALAATGSNTGSHAGARGHALPYPSTTRDADVAGASLGRFWPGT